MNIIKAFLNHLQRPLAAGAKYLAEVDGLRFLAIFLVVIQHLSERIVRHSPIEFSTPIKSDPFAFLVSRGTVGVFLFFAISGFVLALPFGKNTPLSKKTIKTFYLRRLTRIEPPFVIWMTVFAAVLVLKSSYSFVEMLPHWLASITYTHWFLFQEYSVINPVAWSLEIEIQFYLLAPFLATAYFSFQNKVRRRIGMVVLIIGYIIFEGYCGWLHFPMKATLLGRLPNFLIGFLIADFYIYDWKNAPSVSRSIKWDVVAAVALLTMCYTWTEEVVKTLIFNLALAFLFVSAFKSRFFSAFLSIKNIAATGGMCYTIYLIHLPLLEAWSNLMARWTLTNLYAVTLLWQSIIILPIIWFISALFYILTEKPFMKHDWFKKINLKTLFSMTYKKMVKLTTFFFFIFLTTNLVAQPEIELDSTTAKTLRLRPLSVLTNLALQSSAQIKANTIDEARLSLAYQVQKKSWADLIGLSVNTIYGNGSVLDASGNGTTTSYLLSDRKNFNTNISLGMRISAADFLTRGTKADMQKVQIDRVRAEKEIIEDNIRETVLTLYVQLELSLKKIKMRAEGVENQRISFVVAEKYFKEGNYLPSEYSTLLSRIASAEDQYEDAKAETKKLQLLLRNLVKAPIFEK